MTKAGFVIANLFRKRTRTILTLLSVIMAFLLFGLLQSVNSLFSAGADFVGATRLMTQARVSSGSSRMMPAAWSEIWPVSMRRAIQAVSASPTRLDAWASPISCRTRSSSKRRNFRASCR